MRISVGPWFDSGPPDVFIEVCHRVWRRWVSLVRRCGADMYVFMYLYMDVYLYVCWGKVCGHRVAGV